MQLSSKLIGFELIEREIILGRLMYLGEPLRTGLPEIQSMRNTCPASFEEVNCHMFEGLTQGL